MEECDGTTVREELGEHIDSMVRLISLPNNVKSFLHRIGLEENVFTQALKIAVVFHDIGKAYYQNNWRKEKCKKERKRQRKYLSFMGHEFLSACILHHTLKKPSMIELESSQWEIDYDFIKGAIIYAILYHHHAMAYQERKEEILYGKNSGISQPSPEEIEYLAHIMRETLGGKTGKKLGQQLTQKLPEKIVTKNCLENIQAKIKLPWTQNPSKMPPHTPFTLQRLLLTYLLALDNTSATQARNKRRQTPYLKSIKTFTQNYLQTTQNN